jgi:hypothetical protein
VAGAQSYRENQCSGHFSNQRRNVNGNLLAVRSLRRHDHPVPPDKAIETVEIVARLTKLEEQLAAKGSV